MIKIVLLSLLLSLNVAFAQSDDDGYQEPLAPGEEPPAPSIDSAPPAAPAPRATRPTRAAAPAQTSAPTISTDDYLKPGWNPTKLDTGLGFGSSFLGGGTTVIYDTGLTKRTSWTYYFGYNKTSDSFSGTSSSSVSGVGTTTSSTTNSNSGTKNPKILSIGASWNQRLFKNHFMQARWGLFGGIDYYTKVSYAKGSNTTSVTSSAPTTVNYSEAAMGSTDVTKSPGFKIGPVVDTYLFLRWIPNIAVGMQGGMLYTMDQKTKTHTSTVTQSYQILNGVAQTPSSYTSSDSTQEDKTGGAGSTFAANGATFNLFGNFVIRYTW
jgi:hypothetical protein